MDITVGPIKTDVVEVATKESERDLLIAQELAVTDQISYEKVCAIRKEAKKRIKGLEVERKKATGPLNIAKQTVMGWFRKPTDICLNIVGICDKGMLTWTEKQEQIRKKEQDRLDRQATAERLRKEKQERDWKEKAKAKEDEAHKLMAEGKKEEALKAQEEADKAATKADERGEAANGVVAPVIAPQVDKVAGTHYMTRWYGEVIDFKLLPDAYKMADQAKINKVAQATKGTMEIPGVKITESKRPVSRTG